MDPADQRGRFEKSCCEIGAGLLMGGLIGGVWGFKDGLMDKTTKTLPTKYLKGSHILNHIVKSGGGLAQSCGSIMLIYALSDTVIYKSTDTDDYRTTLGATTATGFFYSIPHLIAREGWKASMKYTGLGFAVGALTTAYSLYDKAIFN